MTKGNFISTQSILTKRTIIKKFLFDTNIPRLQDYDFLLRIIPKVKVSFTKEILGEINIQKDSISSSLIKLQEAIKIILFFYYYKIWSKILDNLKKKFNTSLLIYLLKELNNMNLTKGLSSENFL